MYDSHRAGSAWWKTKCCAHPATGSGKKGSDGVTSLQRALGRVGPVICNPCDVNWYNSGRADRCPNNGRCFPGVVVPRLLRRYHDVTAPMINAIKQMHAIKRSHRGNVVLEQLKSWTSVPVPGRSPVVVHRIPEADNVAVCRYAYAHWYGLSKSMIQGTEAAARRGDSAYNVRGTSSFFCALP